MFPCLLQLASGDTDIYFLHFPSGYSVIMTYSYKLPNTPPPPPPPYSHDRLVHSTYDRHSLHTCPWHTCSYMPAADVFLNSHDMLVQHKVPIPDVSLHSHGIQTGKSVNTRRFPPSPRQPNTNTSTCSNGTKCECQYPTFASIPPS